MTKVDYFKFTDILIFLCIFFILPLLNSLKLLSKEMILLIGSWYSKKKVLWNLPTFKIMNDFFFFFRNKPNVDPNLVHYFWCDFRYSLCPKLMMIQYPLRDICNRLGIGMSISHWFLYEVRFSGFIFKRTILINNCNIKLQDEKCLFSVLYTFVFTDLTE